MFLSMFADKMEGVDQEEVISTSALNAQNSCVK